jgi:hypothetical protein
MVEFFAGTAPSAAAAHALESSPPHEEPAAVVVGAVHLMPGPGLSALASVMLGTGVLGALRRATHLFSRV